MPKPIADEVRAKVIAAIASGVAAREAARRFGVSVSSAIKWGQRWRESGDYAPRMPERRRASRLSSQTDWLLELARAEPGMTLDGVRRQLAARGVSVALSSVWRFYHRHGIRLRGARRPGSRAAAGN